MTSTPLQTITNLTRKILAIGAMILMAILVIYFGIKIGFAIKEALHPTPPPPPTVSYGKLPEINFPTQTDIPSFTYTLNTVTGDLPDLGDRATVHPIQQIQPSLLALQNAEEQVGAIGFTDTPTAVSDTNYAWTNADPLPKTLNFNIQTDDFTLTSNYLTDPTVLAAQNVPDQTTAVQTITDFLTNLTILPTDIDTNKTKVSLFEIANGILTPASSLSNAQVVRVDFFQADVNKLPILYANPSYSSMNMLLASTDDEQPQIVAANFFHRSISSRSATYPIKTPQEAYKELQAGNAYFASFLPDTQQIIIRNVSLGYFMSDTDQQYLLPIYVFQGDNNFFAYVSAVDNSWIEK